VTTIFRMRAPSRVVLSEARDNENPERPGR